jgi:hypothetical protein
VSFSSYRVDMSLFLRQRAANPHLGVPPIAGADGVDVDAVVALILDDHGASSEITTAVSTAGGRPVDPRGARQPRARRLRPPRRRTGSGQPGRVASGSWRISLKKDLMLWSDNKNFDLDKCRVTYDRPCLLVS